MQAAASHVHAAASQVHAAASQIGAQVAAVPVGIVNKIYHEVRVTYLIVWRDLSASLIPATLFSLAALHYGSDEWTLGGVATTLFRCFTYFSLYIYSFCLCNQIVGYEEDKVNKPDRVLPSRMISIRGAVARWAGAMVLFPLVGWTLGGLPILRWALAWQVIFLSYNFLGLHRHWFTKNVIFITLGTVVQLAPAWELVVPLDVTAWRWIFIVALSFGLTLHLQDLRDIHGDRLVGRKTLPLVIGQTWTRRFLALSIGLLPLVTHFGLVHQSTLTPSIIILECGLAAINIVVAIRTLRYCSPRADHHTYILHTYWFCAVLAGGFFVL